MIIFSGIDTVLGNVLKLVGTETEYKNISSFEQLRTSFLKFLDSFQVRLVSRGKRDVFYPKEEEDNLYFKSLFLEDTILNDLSQSTVITDWVESCFYDNKNKVENGLSCLRNYGSLHYEMIKLVITEIFFMGSRQASGGSTSNAIGVIWMNSLKDFSSEDMVEFLVHELTHHLMFIDEVCSEHYNYDLVEVESNRPLSAILKINRPFDKVLHSAVVAMELLLFRMNFSGNLKKVKIHPSSEVLLEQTRQTIVSMDEVISRDRNILKDRGHEILENVRHGLDSLKTASF